MGCSRSAEARPEENGMNLYYEIEGLTVREVVGEILQKVAVPRWFKRDEGLDYGLRVMD